jgi:hypothetical protein
MHNGDRVAKRFGMSGWIYRMREVSLPRALSVSILLHNIAVILICTGVQMECLGMPARPHWLLLIARGGGWDRKSLMTVNDGDLQGCMIAVTVFWDPGDALVQPLDQRGGALARMVGKSWGGSWVSMDGIKGRIQIMSLLDNPGRQTMAKTPWRLSRETTLRLKESLDQVEAPKVEQGRPFHGVAFPV